jgi:hypothetical protein
VSVPEPTDDWDPTVTDPAPGPVYDSLPAWVEDWLSPTVRRHVRNTVKWCGRWWAHPEAAARLGALWAAWEVAMAEGGSAMSQWWVYHFDSHWPVLTDAQGPFAGCHPDKPCSWAARLPVTPCPPDVFQRPDVEEESQR